MLTKTSVIFLIVMYFDNIVSFMFVKTKPYWMRLIVLNCSDTQRKIKALVSYETFLLKWVIFASGNAKFIYNYEQIKGGSRGRLTGCLCALNEPITTRRFDS